MVITTYFSTELVYTNNIKILRQEESIMSYEEYLVELHIPEFARLEMA